MSLNKQDYQQYWAKAMAYDTYYQQAETQAQSGDMEGYAQYVPLNFQRMKRIGKTVNLTADMQATLAALPSNIYWLVLSEAWCGDASQIMPVLDAIAKASQGKIAMRVVLRDDNLPLMNAHLTGQSSSIPKIIQMNENFDIIGTWGPRPAQAQALVMELKAKQTPFAVAAETLHKWYADDKQLSTQAELVELLKANS